MRCNSPVGGDDRADCHIVKRGRVSKVAKMAESMQSLVARAVINLKFARAELTLGPTTARRRQTIKHINEAIADLVKVTPWFGETGGSDDDFVTVTPNDPTGCEH
jgi:hypothetical protein